MMNRPARFSFVDEGEAVRRLGVDRDTVLAWVQAGTLRAYPGVGKGSFFRLSDLEALAAERASNAAQTAHAEAAEEAAPGKKQHDPAYKVHVRLTADLKWYDLTDADLSAWVRELHPSAYEKQRGNITRVKEKLDRLVALMDEAADHWATRSPRPPSEPAHESISESTPPPAEGA